MGEHEGGAGHWQHVAQHYQLQLQNVLGFGCLQIAVLESLIQLQQQMSSSSSRFQCMIEQRVMEKGAWPYAFVIVYYA